MDFSNATVYKLKKQPKVNLENLNISPALQLEMDYRRRVVEAEMKKRKNYSKRRYAKKQTNHYERYEESMLSWCLRWLAYIALVASICYFGG